MSGDSILVPFSWRRGFGLARLAVGSSVAVCLLWDGPSRTWPMLIPAVLYIFFAGLRLPRNVERAAPAVKPMLVDLAYFLLVSSQFGVTGVWGASAVFVFITLNSAVLAGWRESFLTVACSALWVVLIPGRPLPLLVTVASGGAAASVLALHGRFLKERFILNAAKVVHARALAENAREDERRRIAADFHDGPLQSFIGLQVRLEILRKLLARDPAAAGEELVQLQDLCRGQVTELRAFVRSMRQAETADAGLAASIRHLVEIFQKDSGIPATFTGADIAGPEDPEMPLEALQIVREALHNVQKHSKASRVAVSVAKSASGIEISVEDDGCGFPFGGAFNLRELDALGIGPVSIRRRVAALGGDLTLDSRPGRGASLQVRVPL